MLCEEKYNNWGDVALYGISDKGLSQTASQCRNWSVNDGGSTIYKQHFLCADFRSINPCTI